MILRSVKRVDRMLRHHGSACHLLRKVLFAYLKAFHAVPEKAWVVPRDRFEFHLHLMETELPSLYSSLTAPFH